MRDYNQAVTRPLWPLCFTIRRRHSHAWKQSTHNPRREGSNRNKLNGTPLALRRYKPSRRLAGSCGGATRFAGIRPPKFRPGVAAVPFSPTSATASPAPT
jgi:hypothetical protein